MLTHCLPITTMDFRIRQGLDLRLNGAAAETVETMARPEYCHIRPSDFRWLKPHLLVAEGDSVDIGKAVFTDKNDERVQIVSPVKGTVKEIVRGEKRVIECISIALDRDPGTIVPVTFEDSDEAPALRSLLLQYGLWPCLRQRPFSVIPSPDAQPKAIFISCFDTAPLAPSMSFLLHGKEKSFAFGLQKLQQAAGSGTPIHLCVQAGKTLELSNLPQNTYIHHFSGPHPAGNVGPQIHRVAPLDKGESVWYVHPLDVARIGRFFQEKLLGFDTTFALTGPEARSPHYYASFYGADLSGLLKDTLKKEAVQQDITNPDKHATADEDESYTPRIISGNILTGKQIKSHPSLSFYDHQLTLIQEGGEREVLGWFLPGLRKWSFSHTFFAWLSKRKAFNFNTSQHGDHRNFVMTDIYEKVFPFDNIPPLELLKACLTHDLDKMEELGIYEVDDEDFALCEVVCPSKMPCQEIVREGLREDREEVDN